jgi:antitoxin VapB
MGDERHVRLFRNGRSQAVRIPRDFELPGADAIMRKEDGKLVIEPVRKKSLKRLLALMDTWEPLDEDDQFPEIDDPPPKPFNLFDDL